MAKQFNDFIEEKYVDEALEKLNIKLDYNDIINIINGYEGTANSEDGTLYKYSYIRYEALLIKNEKEGVV